MSDMMTALEAGSAYLGEHSYSRIIAGDVESVCARLIYALERLDYRVLSDQPPILAKRAARRSMIAADFLDINRRLTVSLRPKSETATLATFDFVVTHAGIMTKGDRRTLELEAEAVVALALARPETSVCVSCGTENALGARFCRHCGTPSAASEEPAELEVTRLTAGARAAHQEIIFGIILMLFFLAVCLPLMLLGKPKAGNAGLILLLIGQLLGWLMTLYGVRRLHRTLNPKQTRERALPSPTPAPAPQTLPGAQAPLLPPMSAQASVTEGTTELLDAKPRARVAVPVRRAGANTDPIN
jgi:ribosomal protein L40E